MKDQTKFIGHPTNNLVSFQDETYKKTNHYRFTVYALWIHNIQNKCVYNDESQISRNFTSPISIRWSPCQNINYLHDYMGNQGSVVTITTQLQAGWSVVHIPVCERYFSVLQNVQSSTAAHPASYPMGSSPGIKQSGHEVNTCTSI